MTNPESIEELRISHAILQKLRKAVEDRREISRQSYIDLGVILYETFYPIGGVTAAITPPYRDERRERAT